MIGRKQGLTLAHPSLPQTGLAAFGIAQVGEIWGILLAGGPITKVR